MTRNSVDYFPDGPLGLWVTSTAGWAILLEITLLPTGIAPVMSTVYGFGDNHPIVNFVWRLPRTGRSSAWAAVKSAICFESGLKFSL